MANIKHTLLELKAKLDAGDLTSEGLVREYLDQIDRLNPTIHAYLYVAREEALAQARILDQERAAGTLRGPLHGLPIALKDNMSVEGMQNTCASKFLEGYVAPYDATIVKKLKEAGAVILGKLNMDEFAMGSSTEYSAYGDTKNPWSLDRIPGGSSGGSAAALSAMMAPITLGTDTGGSVRQPAAFNNLVGLKPTYGRISRYGITAFGSTLDQVGVFARDVRDCALMAGVLSGMDPMDSTTADEPVPDYLAGLTADLSGVRLALPKSFLDGLKEPMKGLLLHTVEEYRALGATVDEIDLTFAHNALAVYYIVASAEASSNLARFDGIRYGRRAENPVSARDLYTRSRSEGFGEEVKRRIMLGTYVLSAGFYDAYYNTALKVRTLIKEELRRVFTQYDAIIGPTTPTGPRRLGERSDNIIDEYLNDLYTVPANIAGVPAIAFPMGFAEAIPMSCQLIGDYFSEPKLFQIAYAYEKAHDHITRYPEVATI
ncbi:Glutamyl-tRNA(Gln) amidotransferase subunit A [anaerobic digester metagenome]